MLAPSHMVINELGDFLLLWNTAEYECNFLQHSGVIAQHNIAFDNGIEGRNRKDVESRWNAQTKALLEGVETRE